MSVACAAAIAAMLCATCAQAAVVASVVLDACGAPQSPEEGVACVMKSASDLIARAARANAGFMLLPEAAGWRWALVAPESERRASLREFAVRIAVGDAPCGDGDGDGNDSVWARRGQSGIRGGRSGARSGSGGVAGQTMLRGIACLAQRFSVEVVFDTLTVQPCAAADAQRCAPDGVLLYNSAVAITADGKVAAVYHKSHLFGTAPFLDEPERPHAVSYLSPALGRRVGLMVCYDLDFSSPAAELLAAGVRTFAMPFDWPSTPPLMTPPMLQQAWSRSFGVDLIASNLYEAHGGSGIFSDGAVLAFLPADAKDAFVVAELPRAGARVAPGYVVGVADGKDALAHRHLDFVDGDARAQALESLQFPCAVASYPGFNGSCSRIGVGNGTVASATHGNILCDARVKEDEEKKEEDGVRAASRRLMAMSPSTRESYVLFAFDGTLVTPNTPDAMTVRVCAVMQCVSGDDDGALDSSSNDRGTTVCVAEETGSLTASVVTVHASIQKGSTIMSAPAQLHAMAAVGRGELLPPSLLEVHSTEDATAAVASLALPHTEPLFALVLYILYS